MPDGKSEYQWDFTKLEKYIMFYIPAETVRILSKKKGATSYMILKKLACEHERHSTKQSMLFMQSVHEY